MADKLKFKDYTKGTYTKSDELKDLESQQSKWYGQDYKQFSWDDSMASDTTKNYLNNLNSLKAPEWNGYSRQGEWDNILNNITNMKDFSYDVNGDALYQQYKDTYATQGKMAMMDTMGQAAALTGGYGNSYAQSVGQQTYQGYMQQLADKVPELYSLALSKYNSDRDNLYKQNDMHQSLFNNEYGMYRDDVTDYNTNRDYYANQYNAGLTRDYNAAVDVNNSYNSIISNNRTDYATAVNNLANREWGQYTDNESLASQAIQIYNDNIAAQASNDLANQELDLKNKEFLHQQDYDTKYLAMQEAANAWNKEYDQMQLDAQKAQNATNNALQQSELDWKKQQSNLQAQVDALTNQYVVDNAAMDKVAKSILSEDEFKEKATMKTTFNGKEATPASRMILGANNFKTSYTYNGNTFNSYKDYVDYALDTAYNNGNGTINRATLEALLEKYGIV